MILAAGGSTRFGGDVPKQLARFDGEALVVRAARAALGSRLAQIVVVLGHAAGEAAATLDPLSSGSTPGARSFETVVNPVWAQGQSTSVRAGLERVDPRAEAAIFLPCDQPFLEAAVVDAALDVYRETRAPIVMPAYGERRGAPVLFTRALFPELRTLEGDAGGRVVAGRHPDLVHLWQLADERPLLDVDRAADLERLR